MMLPVETLRQILLQLSRDDLDAVELVNRHLRSIILSDIIVKWGPLRALDAVSVRSVNTMSIMHGPIESRYPTTGARLKDTFVYRVDIDGRDEHIIRWFLTVLPRMRMVRFGLIVPVPVERLQEQLFSVLKCRDMHLSWWPLLARNAFTYCDRLSLHSLAFALRGPTNVVLLDGIVTLLYSEKRNTDDDAPCDVIVGPQPPDARCFSASSLGYERLIYMESEHIGGGGVRRLVAALREKAVNTTLACAPYFVRINNTTLEAHELPPMRYLNRVTGQHFVVDSDGRSSTTIKCITVIRPRK